MVEKGQVLPVGSIVTVKFDADMGRVTTALIVGHLSLLKPHKCFYDYICVEYPYGVEKGTFYINHADIICVSHRTDDSENKHEKWMERKYGEYLAYYNQYRFDVRPTIDELRRRKARAEDFQYKYFVIRRMMRIMASVVFALGIGISAWQLKSILPIPIGLFCVLGNQVGE